MDEKILVKNLHFSYGEKEILKGVNLAVHKNEIFCLLGANGSGKTTLIDAILGINRYKTGSITVDSVEISSMKPSEIAKIIAYVPQLHTITFPYTVLEAVMMGRLASRGLFGEPKKEDELICLEALSRVGIVDFKDRPYSRLSGGELKLVLLARALAQRTNVIIMDEPTAHLDIRNELVFLETMTTVVSNEGLTVVMATHSLNHAFYFESLGVDVRAGIMKDGVLKYVGTPKETVTKETIKDAYNIDADIIEKTKENGEVERIVYPINTI